MALGDISSHAGNGLARNSGIYLRPVKGVSLLEVLGRVMIFVFELERAQIIAGTRLGRSE
jgi:hypothetical protein